jgi:hypothetical protein
MTIRRRLESLGRRADGALADSAFLSTRAFGATKSIVIIRHETMIARSITGIGTFFIVLCVGLFLYLRELGRTAFRACCRD